MHLDCLPEDAPRAVALAAAILSESGQELNITKLQIWSPSVPVEAIPAEWRFAYTERLKVMGSPAAFARPQRFADMGLSEDDDWRDAAVTVFAPADEGEPLLARTKLFFARP